MAELRPVHRYAAGALLALALHQAQIHQHSSPSHAGGFTPSDTEDGSLTAEYDEEDSNSWISHHCGLLRPVFRYLKIDPKAWPGLEQTSASSDAKHHIEAFLRILSEEEEENTSTSSSRISSEVDLAEAVEAVALNFKEISTSSVSFLKHDVGEHPTQLFHKGAELQPAILEASPSESATESVATMQEASISFLPSTIDNTESSNESKSWANTIESVNSLKNEGNGSVIDNTPSTEEAHGRSSLCGSMETPLLSSDRRWNVQEATVDGAPLNGSGGLPVLRENYFGSFVGESDPSSSESSRMQKELGNTTSVSDELESRELKKAVVDGPNDRETSENSLNDNAISEGRLLPQERKVAVLYELLSASVADIPAEEGDDKLRLRRGYDARQRVALRLLATWLDVKWTKMAAMEIMVAYSAMAAQEEREANKDEKDIGTKNWAKWKRGGLIGAAALTGGALLALTGGLAAPAIAAGLSALAPTLGTIIPVIGSTGFAAAAAAAASTVGSVAVAASFGAAGAGLTGSKMARRTGGVDEFGFEGIGENHQQGRLAVGIVVSGFINDPKDFTNPWKGQDGDLERYALRWETKNLIAISTAIQDWLTSSITKELMKQGAMLTVLSTLLSALAWPSALLTLTDFIDSKWVVAVDRSDKAGKLLAEVLLKGLQGNRPVTLIGFSLGARVIFKCLEKLAKKGENGRIVERVVLLGAPISLETQRWETVRKVVAGRFVNAYSTSDWLLAVVYRASLLSQGLAGIQAVNVPGIENVDLTDVIKGHSSYLSKVGEILEAIDIDCYSPIFPSKICASDSNECSQST